MSYKMYINKSFFFILIIFSLILISSCASNKDFFPKIKHYESRSDGAIRVTNCSGINSCQNPVFSPDGREIIFTRFMKGYNQGPSEIVRLNLETGREKIIVKNESDNVNVPYGSWIKNKIIFASDKEGIEEIYLANDNGGKAKRLTAHYVFEGSYIEPSFNPANSNQVVFEYSRESGEHYLKFLDLGHKIASSGLADLTTNQEYDDRLPSFSPDGKTISWQRTKVDKENWQVYAAELYLEPRPRLTNMRAITPGPDNTDNSWMWSGKYILSSTTVDGEIPNIFAFPAQPGKPIRVTSSRENEDGAPSNSQDSKLIAFESHEEADENSPSEIWIIRTPQMLWNESYQENQEPIELVEADIDQELRESENLAKELDVDEVDKDFDDVYYLPNLSDRNIQTWIPEQGRNFQWQFTGKFNPDVDADVYHLDGIDTDAKIINELHAKGKRVVCYINTGAWENWRNDKDDFPSSVIGKDYSGWSGEKWLDIKKTDILLPIIGKRFDICKKKGFDAIEPDNIDGYLQDTGFTINYEDQIKFNKLLAEKAHERGMSIGLKNDGDQVKDLVDDYDFGITESCFTDNFCEQFTPFSENKKAVAMIEYTDTKVDFNKACSKAKELGFSAVLKNRNLDEFRTGC